MAMGIRHAWECECAVPRVCVLSFDRLQAPILPDGEAPAVLQTLRRQHIFKSELLRHTLTACSICASTMRDCIRWLAVPNRPPPAPSRYTMAGSSVASPQ